MMLACPQTVKPQSPNSAQGMNVRAIITAVGPRFSTSHGGRIWVQAKFGHREYPRKDWQRRRQRKEQRRAHRLLVVPGPKSRFYIWEARVVTFLEHSEPKGAGISRLKFRKNSRQPNSVAIPKRMSRVGKFCLYSLAVAVSAQQKGLALTTHTWWQRWLGHTVAARCRDFFAPYSHRGVASFFHFCKVRWRGVATSVRSDIGKHSHPYPPYRLSLIHI